MMHYVLQNAIYRNKPINPSICHAISIQKVSDPKTDRVTQ